MEIVDLMQEDASRSQSFSMQEDASRSRQGLSNAYLVAKIGLDTAENGQVEV